MAIAVDTTGGPTRVDNLSVSSVTTSHSHTVAGSNRYFVHLVAIRRLTLDIASGSYNSVAYTELVQHDQGTTNRSIIFGLTAPATGANTAALVSGGTVADDIAHGSISLTGVDQTTPAAATPIAFGGTNPSSTIATANGGYVLVCVSYQNEVDGVTAPTAGTWTTHFSSTGAGDAAFYVFGRAGDGTTYTIDPDGSGAANLAVTAISLAPSVDAATGFGTTTMRRRRRF